MGKKVPRGLIYCGERIRTITDLKEHFLILDVYTDYKSGELLDWLEHGSYKDEIEKINELNKEDEIEELKGLCGIFDKKYETEELKVIIELYKNCQKANYIDRDYLVKMINKQESRIHELENINQYYEPLKNVYDQIQEMIEKGDYMAIVNLLKKKVIKNKKN